MPSLTEIIYPMFRAYRFCSRLWCEHEGTWREDHARRDWRCDLCGGLIPVGYAPSPRRSTWAPMVAPPLPYADHLLDTCEHGYPSEDGCWSHVENTP